MSDQAGDSITSLIELVLCHFQQMPLSTVTGPTIEKKYSSPKPSLNLHITLNEEHND